MKNNYLLILLCCFNLLIFTKPAAGFNSQVKKNMSINGYIFIPVKIFAFNAIHQDGKDLLKWDVSISPDLVQFQIESSTDNINFSTIDSVYPKVVDNDAASYDYYSPFPVTGTRYYRIELIYDNGYTEYSPISKLDDATTNRVVVLNNGLKQFHLVTPYPLHSISVVNASGQIVQRYTEVPAGSQTIDLNNFTAGVYWIQCLSDKNEIITVMNN